MADAVPPWAELAEGSLTLRVIVVPRASRTEWVGVHDQRLKARIKAPPVDGAANKALLQFVAKQLGLPKSKLSITAGSSSKRKTILATCADPKQRLLAVLANLEFSS